jgi:integrase
MINKNGPQKGDSTKVDPIRSLDDIKSIHKLLSQEPRNDLLFTLGVHNGLRMCDLLRRKVYEVSSSRIGDSIPIVESKTGKQNILVVNKPVYKSLQKYLSFFKPDEDEYLFRSRQGDGPICEDMARKLIKKWTSAINLRGRYGCHTPRKTWGYIQRVVFKVSFEVICKRYKHSSPRITMAYLGIEDKEVHDVLLNDFY